MPKTKNEWKIDELRNLAKAELPDEFEKYTGDKRTSKGICQFLQNNGIICGQQCPEKKQFCEEHESQYEQKSKAVKPAPMQQKKSYKELAAEKKKAKALAGLAAAGPGAAGPGAAGPGAAGPGAAGPGAAGPGAGPGAAGPAAGPGAAGPVVQSKPLLKKKMVSTQIYNPQAIGELPRYLETRPEKTIYYAPKATALIENIDRVNQNDEPNQFAHMIIGDVPAVSALEATSALIAYGVPLVQIKKPKEDEYEMVWKDENQEHIIATYKEGKVKIVPSARGGQGVLLLSRKWPFVSAESTAARSKEAEAVMKTFSLRVMNSFENRDGALIRYIVLDFEYKEGNDVFNVKYIHLFSPMANAADRVQSVGRGVRRCGQRYQQFIPGQGWTVEVFVYATDLKVVEGQTEVAELALAPSVGLDAKITALITQQLYDNAISKVLWTCSQLEFVLEPPEHDPFAYFRNLQEWLNNQTQRGISKAESDLIQSDLRLIYNEIGKRHNLSLEDFTLVQSYLINTLEEHLYVWDLNEANTIYQLDQILEEIPAAQNPRLGILYESIKKAWPRIPTRVQHQFYGMLSQRIPELTPPRELPKIQPIAPPLKLAPLGVPTLESLSSIVGPLPERNKWLAALRSTYQPGYQFPEWILLTDGPAEAEVWVVGQDTDRAVQHSYERIPSMDIPTGAIHYDPDAFQQTFYWNLDMVKQAAVQATFPLYAVYTYSKVAQTLSCDRAAPTYYDEPIHILHAFMMDYDSLEQLAKLILAVAMDKKATKIYLPVFGNEFPDQPALAERWLELVQKMTGPRVIYGPTNVNPTDYGLDYDDRRFFDIYFRSVDNPLFVNHWNPYTMIGNGNCGQDSLDGQIGRLTNSIALGWWGANQEIKTRTI